MQKLHSDGRITEFFGFDLGDGESAVAWLKKGALNEPQLIEIAGRKSALTALGEHREMGTLIGEQAFLADADKLYLRFKSEFLSDRERTAPLIRRFASAVRDELMRSGKLTDPAAAAFFIGCPSGWDEREKREYRLLFEQAGYRNVKIISESRAAFMFVRESGELQLPNAALSGPTLIIDSGSSTTDFTFINRLETVHAFDFGEVFLGGGLIDRMLLMQNLQNHPRRDELEAIFERSPQYRARAELEARKVKEMYFTRRAHSPGTHFQLPCESSVKIYATSPPITLELMADDALMERVLNTPIPRQGGLGFLDAYRKGLLSAQKALIDTPPELILLTGGASRMDFITTIAREVFPQAQFLHGAEPEFSIARGLCYALRVDDKADAFEGEVGALIESDAVEQILLRALPKLLYQVGGALTDSLIDECALVAFKSWRRGELATLGEMSEALKLLLMDSVEEGAAKDSLNALTRTWIAGIRPELEALTDPICAKYDLPLTSLRLPSALQVDPLQLALNPGDIMDFSLLQTAVDVAVASIVAAILGGGGVALLMAGPVGLLVSFAIGFVFSRLGTGYAKRHLDNVSLPPLVRRLFTVGTFRRHLQGKRDQLEQLFSDQLIMLIDPPNAQIEQLMSSVSGAIEAQLGQLAEQARLLIH